MVRVARVRVWARRVVRVRTRVGAGAGVVGGDLVRILVLLAGVGVVRADVGGLGVDGLGADDVVLVPGPARLMHLAGRLLSTATSVLASLSMPSG